MSVPTIDFLFRHSFGLFLTNVKKKQSDILPQSGSQSLSASMGNIHLRPVQETWSLWLALFVVPMNVSHWLGGGFQQKKWMSEPACGNGAIRKLKLKLPGLSAPKRFRNQTKHEHNQFREIGYSLQISKRGRWEFYGLCLCVQEPEIHLLPTLCTCVTLDLAM